MTKFIALLSVLLIVSGAMENNFFTASLAVNILDTGFTVCVVIAENSSDLIVAISKPSPPSFFLPEEEDDDDPSYHEEL